MSLNWLEIWSESVRYQAWEWCHNGPGSEQSAQKKTIPLTRSLSSAEVIGPGAHLEAGRHLAQPALQDLHLAVGLCLGEQRGLLMCVSLVFSSPVLTMGLRLCLQKRPLQTDGWPEVDELKQVGLIDGQDTQLAKSVILNWIKDLRAQPEVADLLLSPVLGPKQRFAQQVLFALSKVCGPGNLWLRFWRTCSRRGGGAVLPICWRLWRWSCGRS